MRIWLTYWRDLMLASSGAHAPLTNLDNTEALQQVAQQIDFSTARRVPPRWRNHSRVSTSASTRGCWWR